MTTRTVAHADRTRDLHTVAQLQAGDEQAFLALVERNNPALLAIARSELDRRSASDVVRETWHAVLDSLDGYHGECSLRGWIFSRFEQVMHARRLGAAPTLADGPAPAMAVWFSTTGGWAAPVHAFDDAVLVRAETTDLVRRELGALPSLERQVLLLRDIGGWSAQEISEALGIAESEERSLIHRARTRVRAGLDLHLHRSPSADAGPSSVTVRH
jgi:RNA polymerase sigma-70 factor, ECF subfamily